MESPARSEHEQLFYNDGYRLGQEAAQEGLVTSSLFKSIKSLFTAIDQLNDSLLAMAARQSISVACHKGCEWCCHQAVYANSYEIHYLSDFIKKNFSEADQQLVLQKANQKNELTEQLSEEEISRHKSACALLLNGSCMAYGARPMACRIYLSTNLPSCLEFFHHPKNEANYPALLDFPLMAGRMMNEGFMAALREKGTETAEFRLEEGLAIALSQDIDLK